MIEELILATSNPGKRVELEGLIPSKIAVRCMDASAYAETPPAETGLSFVENALLKARHASLKGNKPALADDSGLVVASLHGEPGIYSARYAGDNATDADNIALLLQNLAPFTEQAARRACFYCVIVVVRHAKDPMPCIAVGEWQGFIHSHPKGNNGFGYDPIFYLPEYNCTVAELAPDVKNTVSHRAKALAALQSQLLI